MTEFEDDVLIVQQCSKAYNDWAIIIWSLQLYCFKQSVYNEGKLFLNRS